MANLQGSAQGCHPDSIVQEAKPVQHYYDLSPSIRTPLPSHDVSERRNLKLLDTCLVASVDGKFHALSRSSGKLLWSMGSSSSHADANSKHVAVLGPLVYTQHANLDHIPDESRTNEEAYIIEYHSGDIYIRPKPNGPLQKLPFSVSALVNMGPKHDIGHDVQRSFVGKKETSLLLLELDTGKLKGTINADAEFVWDSFGSHGFCDLDDANVQIESIPMKVCIGRTDYHVSIYTRHRNPSEPRAPVRKLTFSSYGPNNQDPQMQTNYLRTLDDRVILPTATGDLTCFQTTSSNSIDRSIKATLLWTARFQSRMPIVAVFDILQSPNQASPMALLQPRPPLLNFSPCHSSTPSPKSTERSDFEANMTAYVGVIPENRALYALSAQHYPLAIQPPDYLFERWRNEHTLEFVEHAARIEIDTEHHPSNPPLPITFVLPPETTMHEGDDAAIPGKNGRERRSRKKNMKKKGKPANGANDGNDRAKDGKSDVELDTTAPLSPMLGISPSNSLLQIDGAEDLLKVSDVVLGRGSNGTVVYRGSFQGRLVAVKRLINEFFTLAEREVLVLQESDGHPNVIRYYYKHVDANFSYIVLELCPATLADVIQDPDTHHALSKAFDSKRALQQVTDGLRHLHGMKIVHRDIKPQNILVSAVKGSGGKAEVRMVISDFGLCRKLDMDETSFSPSAHGEGTRGWRAPEVLRGEVDLSHQGITMCASSEVHGISMHEKATQARLTKLIDIFALGCLFYYVLTRGKHPYGDPDERKTKILTGAKDLSALEVPGEEDLEAIDVITLMLDPEPSKRPDAMTCLLHPFLWSSSRRFDLLQDVSDRLKHLRRNPRHRILDMLESGSDRVMEGNWRTKLDEPLVRSLEKFKAFDGNSVQDLLRAVRNTKHHYREFAKKAQRCFRPPHSDVLSYFTKRFPHLFMHVYSIVSQTELRREPMFRRYFALSE